jgi:hypothetical protein
MVVHEDLAQAAIFFVKMILNIYTDWRGNIVFTPYSAFGYTHFTPALPPLYPSYTLPLPFLYPWSKQKVKKR